MPVTWPPALSRSIVALTGGGTWSNDTSSPAHTPLSRPAEGISPLNALATTTRTATTIVAAIRFMTSTSCVRDSLMAVIMRGAGRDATEEFLTLLSGATRQPRRNTPAYARACCRGRKEARLARPGAGRGTGGTKKGGPRDGSAREGALANECSWRDESMGRQRALLRLQT